MSVGLVVVSHSARLAEGVAELATQMAPDIVVAPAGGGPDGGLGTDVEKVAAALARARGDAATGGDGVVVLYDLGSARMSAELAIEMLDDPAAAVVVDAPLVEGAVAAAVAAQGGAGREAVARAAASAGGAAPDEAGDTSAPAAGDAHETTLTLTNQIGLHARPAALLARAVAGLDARVRVRRADGTDEQAVDAASVLGVMGLRAGRGDRIVVSASGRQAEQALRRVERLVARDFDE